MLFLLQDRSGKFSSVMYLIILFNLFLSLFLDSYYFTLGFLDMSSVSLSFHSLLLFLCVFAPCCETVCPFNLLNYQLNIHHSPVYCSISLLCFNIQRLLFFSETFMLLGCFIATSFYIPLRVFILVFYFVFVSHCILFLSLNHP